jgi:multiple sugar transport system substrate-binding protein
MAAAACGSSSSSPPVAANTKQTIVFAESGLGAEGAQTAVAIKAFEVANPNITVKTDVLSPDSTTYLSQLEHSFIAGSTTPDIFESDVTYPAKFAQAGWIYNLSTLNATTSQYFPHEVAAGTFNGKIYAIPWFDNPEGLFYRTDLIKTPPTSPAQIVSDAEMALKADPKLKEGIAFEGSKYEGAITAYMTVLSAFGGKLDPTDINTSGNVAALTWLYDCIYKYHIAPTAVTGWTEGNVESEFISGYAAFSINYPFVEPLATAPPVKGNVGYIPFPAGPGGTPGSALGGEMLAINSKTTHAAAAYKFIQYMTSAPVEVARAEATGDPPSLPSAYTAALYAKAPYFQNVKVLNSYSAPRPVSPNYLQISSDLQDMISSVYANSESPAKAIASEAPTIKSDAAATPS